MANETLEYRFEETGLDDLRKDMKRLAEDFEDAGGEALDAGDDVVVAMESGEASVEDLQQQLDQIDTREALTSMQRLSGALEDIEDKLDRLDNRTIDVDTDVDRARMGGTSGGRGGGRMHLPGELDEVAEFGGMLMSLSPQVQAALAGLATAGAASAAALGAGGGLAAVATQLAAELGPAGLQGQVQSVVAEYKRTGREFASAFDDVITGIVLPAGRGFAQGIRNADEALAAFSGTVLANLDSLPGPLGMIGGAAQAAINAGSGQSSNAEALAEGIGDVPGIRKTLTKLTQQIDRVREKFRRGLIPKKEMLSQIEGFRMEAVTSLQKLQQQVPGVFPPGLLDAQARKLRRIQKRIEAIAFAEKGAQMAQENEPKPIQGEAPEAASPGRGVPVPQQLAPMQATQQQITFLDKFREQLKLSKREMSALNFRVRRFGNEAGRAFSRAIQSGESFFGAMNKLVDKLIRSLTRMLIKMVIIKGIQTALSGGGGAAVSAFTGVVNGGMSGSSIMSGMAEGGVVKGPTPALVGEYPGAQSNPEIVSPESKMRDVFASTLRSEGAGAGMNVTVHVTGESRIEGRDIKQSYDTETRVRGRHGIE